MSTLFEPIKIGPLTIKNRFMMAPMENGLANNGGWVNEQLIDFFTERAANDVGIIMTGSIAVSPEGRGLPTQLALYDPDYLPGLKRLVEAVHHQGARIGAQLYHAGRQATAAITGIQPVAPSPLPCALLGNDPRSMEPADFTRIRDDFVTCAKRAVEVGFDLIELHLAHGYLLHSFLSPHSNHRTDRYGGSLENRLQFPIEVVKAVLETCGNSVAVTARVSCEEFLEDGLKFAEGKTVCERLQHAGIQALSITAGSYDSVEYIIQPMSIKQGFLVPYARTLKRIVSIPVIVAARLNNANLVHDIIENGDADMVAIGRGLIADEQFVLKMREYRYDDIRHCIACNQGCIDRVLLGQGINCLVNARDGRYSTRLRKDS